MSARYDLRPSGSSNQQPIGGLMVFDSNNTSISSMDQSLKDESRSRRRGAVRGNDSFSEPSKTKPSSSNNNGPPLAATTTKTTIKPQPTLVESQIKVSFQLDDQNKIVEVVHEYLFEPEMVDEEVWWTDDELDKLLTKAMLVADHFTRRRKDWQESILAILKQCKQTDNKTPVRASELDFVVDSEARGLELYIHPEFQKNREKAIKSVVAIQKQIAAREAEKGPDPEFRINALKNKSMKLTLPARLMAKTLAVGDARAAAKEEKDEEEKDEEEKDEEEKESTRSRINETTEQEEKQES